MPAQVEKLETVQLLLRHGASVTRRDARGNTLLDLAVQHCDVKVARMLQQHTGSPGAGQSSARCVRRAQGTFAKLGIDDSGWVTEMVRAVTPGHCQHHVCKYYDSAIGTIRLYGQDAPDMAVCHSINPRWLFHRLLSFFTRDAARVGLALNLVKNIIPYMMLFCVCAGRKL